MRGTNTDEQLLADSHLPLASTAKTQAEKSTVRGIVFSAAGVAGRSFGVSNTGFLEVQAAGLRGGCIKIPHLNLSSRA